MEQLLKDDQVNYPAQIDTGYSWTSEQLDDYEESLSRDHDHQH